MYQSTNAPIHQLLCLILLLASGCALLSPPPIPTPTPTPLPSPTPWPTPTLLPSPTPWPTPTPEPPDTGWQPLGPGIELRQVRVETGEVAERPAVSGVERLIIVRLEPTLVRFRVHYDPVAPCPVSGWAERIQPLLVVNGGYFTPEDETLALLISDGEVWGAPYEREDEDWVFAGLLGLFAVTADGQVSVRWLGDQPYDPAEPLREALQSFPVLVKPGGVMGLPPDAEEGPPARRTVVAQDRQGRILFIIAPRGYFSLLQLARFLADFDLDLDVALNLDGGRSTGLWLETNERSVRIDSIVPVPSVISADYH